MTEPKKLVQAAEYLAESDRVQEWKQEYFKDMAERLRNYPVDSRDNFYYQEVESVVGFKGVLDIVFNEDSRVSNDGMEGLREAAIEMHTRFIQNQEELGFNPIRSFQKTLPVGSYPNWFVREVAKAELNNKEGSEMNEEYKEYREFLEDILNEESNEE